MDKQLVNPVTVRPDELRAGDVMAVVVTLHVLPAGVGLVYRMYRCKYSPSAVYDDIPQGSLIGGDVESVMKSLFPVVGWAGAAQDSV